MLHQVVQEKRLRGILVCRRGPKISYLFFADDSIIFGRATETKGFKFLRILKVYETSSRQQLNIQKTSLYFSKNMMGKCRIRSKLCSMLR